MKSIQANMGRLHGFEPETGDGYAPSNKLLWMLTVSGQCFFVITPISQYLPDSLFCNLRIAKIFEAIKFFGFIYEDVNVGQLAIFGCCWSKPRLTHQVITPVV